MATPGTRHTVRKGDTLWGLAERHLGDGRRWPSIYEYNNRDDVVAQTGTRIVDPDIILIGQTIVIPAPAAATDPSMPATGGAATKSATGGPGATTADEPGATPPAGGPGGRPLSPERGGRQPAFEDIYLPAFRFSMPKLPIRVLLGVPPTHMAEIKLTGSITIQSERRIDFLTLTKDGAEVSARNEAATALQRLIADSSIHFNPGTGEVTFENSLTVHANTPYAPRAKVTMGISSKTGLPVAKASIKTHPIKGRLNHFVYLTENFGIEIEITQLPRAPRRQPAPQPSGRPMPQRQPLYQPLPPGGSLAPDPFGAHPPSGRQMPPGPSNTEILIGSAIIGAALAIVVVTIVEDIVTLGGGIADDPLSGMVAAGMVSRGWAMVRYAPIVVQSTRTVSSWAARAAPHIERAWRALQSVGSQAVSIMVQGAVPAATSAQ